MNKQEREKLARKWATDCQGAGNLPAYGIAAQAAATFILENTAPPTMADIEWDDDKHYLAGATTPDDTDCVMIWSDLDLSGDIVCDDSAWRPDQLTPNGKRYELVEVTDKPENPVKPEHPETLRATSDYLNAPAGTIVDICGTVAIRLDYRWDVTGESEKLSAHDMFCLGEGVVVRWGE